MDSSPDNLPDELTEVGHIRVSVVMGGEGIGTSFDYEGIALEAAIGYMTVVLDRMKEQAACAWDTCAGCGEALDPEEEGPDHGDADDFGDFF